MGPLLLLMIPAAALAAAPSPPAQAPAGAAVPRARSHTIVGELVRVDLGRRSLTVRTSEGEGRERELAIEEASRIVSGGRVARLEDLRPGERVLATCSDDEAGRHHVRLVKVGPSRYAAPSPSPSPSTSHPPSL